jgi:DNA-directed RNA polymerase subunit RPC12/RpoP/predicted Zn-ribbon and HTH transcriptional regulator
MPDASAKIEYADESFKNLSILMIGLGELLRDRNVFSDEDFVASYNKPDKGEDRNQFITIPVQCSRCSKEGHFKLGEATNCLYCKEKLFLDLANPMTKDSLFGIDADRLFYFKVKPEHVSKDSDLCLINKHIPVAQDIDLRSENIYYEALAISESSKKINMRDRYFEADRIIGASQARVSRLTRLMKVCANAINCSDTDLLWEYLLIDNWKQERKYNSLYKPFVCNKCGTEQWPSSLISSKCVSCSEPYDIDLMPGLLLMINDEDSAQHAFQPIKRNLEILYTLFEAIFTCSASKLGISLEDLSGKIRSNATPYWFEKKASICSACNRQINIATVSSGRCPYCSQNVPLLFWEQFL